ncbi:aspartate dehydrogenase [Seohaeicola saemankumensis]|uniref:aspartate dehydrogenase n=1 Tax=Seohaeicola saemankumensis TaxID=481181 RepID=UPI0035CEE964
MKENRILIIGYGAIASEVVELLMACSKARYFVGILLRPGSASLSRVPQGVFAFDTISEAVDFQPDLVVEAAGHSAVKEVVPALLDFGISVLVTSIGAFHNQALFQNLSEIAELKGARLILPSGALGALDYIRSGRDADGLQITYELRKPPLAWERELKAQGYDPSALADPLVLFEGSARLAADTYPENLNVAAAIALAGPGMDNIKVSVICDPKIDGNTHTVTAKSALGTMRIQIVNQPSRDNPKTSMIVSRSILSAIRQYFSPIQML